ncbi:MAG: hypothetical protein NVS3B21_23450 [Acidimicrobiales bacterium]
MKGGALVCGSSMALVTLSPSAGSFVPLGGPGLATCLALRAPRGYPPYARLMSTFVFRLKSPRPTFALDMTDDEREIMSRHAAYWQTLVDSGQMVVFGPVLDGTGSWGLGVVEADDEEELRAFAAGDPVVTTATATLEMGKMLAGFVRPR